MLNCVNIVGRLVADPQFTPGSDGDESKDRAWGRIACDRRIGKTTDFVPFVCWGAQARAVAQYCQKGRMLALTGELHTRSTQRADGSYDNYAEISAERVGFGPKAKNQPAPAAEAPSAPSPDVAAQLAEQLMRVLPALQAAKAAEASEPHDPFGK